MNGHVRKVLAMEYLLTKSLRSPKYGKRRSEIRKENKNLPNIRKISSSVSEAMIFPGEK